MLNTVPAIFFDRDGTINIDYGYIYQINNFKFIDGSIEALKKLKKMDFVLVLITNQSGIARGIFTECEFLKLTKWMSSYIANYNLNIDGIYYCPHLPEAKIDIYRKNCNCRKPRPGMLFSAQKHLNINMAASYMVGDTIEDMKVAQLAKVGTKVLVRTGKPITHEVENIANLVINSISDLPTYLKS